MRAAAWCGLPCKACPSRSVPFRQRASQARPCFTSTASRTLLQVLAAVSVPAVALRATPLFICSPLPTCNLREMQRTACDLLGRTDYARVVVAHDAAAGVWSAEAARAWVASFDGKAA